MKTLLIAVALSVIAVSSLYAGVSCEVNCSAAAEKIPEPSSLALVVAGISGLGLWFRNRRQ